MLQAVLLGVNWNKNTAGSIYNELFLEPWDEYRNSVIFKFTVTQRIYVTGIFTYIWYDFYGKCRSILYIYIHYTIHGSCAHFTVKKWLGKHKLPVE